MSVCVCHSLIRWLWPTGEKRAWTRPVQLQEAVQLQLCKSQRPLTMPAIYSSSSMWISQHYMWFQQPYSLWQCENIGGFYYNRSNIHDYTHYIDVCVYHHANCWGHMAAFCHDNRTPVLELPALDWACTAELAQQGGHGKLPVLQIKDLKWMHVPDPLRKKGWV